MKTKVNSKYLAIFISFVFAFTFFAPSLVLALPADNPAGLTIQQRIELRKKERNLKLESKELTRLKSRCIGVQNTIRDIQNKLGPTVTNRADIYKKIDAKLWITIGELKLADKDTFNLEKQRAEFTKKVAAFDNSVTQYKQTLDDIVVMNCETDLVGFVALVQTAREYHQDIRKQSVELRAYVVDTIKPSLTAFVNDLQTKPATEGGQ